MTTQKVNSITNNLTFYFQSFLCLVYERITIEKSDMCGNIGKGVFLPLIVVDKRLVAKEVLIISDRTVDFGVYRKRKKS